jgi:hypothetical protein
MLIKAGIVFGTYFEIGRIIVEEEQKGKANAEEYGKEPLMGILEKRTVGSVKSFV